MSDWMLTASGRRFYPLTPKPEDVVLEDIGHALAMTCRFGGHVREFYSVAQHAVLVSEIAAHMAGPRVSLEAALWGLHHDDAEAYLGDVISPLKSHTIVGGWPFASVETDVERAILNGLGLEPPAEEIRRIIHAADLMALATELRDLCARGHGIDVGIGPWPKTIYPAPWEAARFAWLQRHEELISEARAA